MTEEEYDLYSSVEAPHGKWFIPIIWILNLIKQKHQEKAIDSVQFEMLVRHLYTFRDGFAMLYVYDWVKIPLVYTQVVAIATYGYFFICLIGRQPKLDEKSMQTETCILFPIFTSFQILFYIGWLKVGQYLMNPFGEDDDDFELNYVLDRNTCIAMMIASELADQMPSQVDTRMDTELPHTRASFKIQDIMPKSHLSDFRLTNRDMMLIHPEELMEHLNPDGSRQGARANRLSAFLRMGHGSHGGGDAKSKEPLTAVVEDAEEMRPTTAANAKGPM